MAPTPSDHDGDPRIYMAAERTFLAWIRTGIALMAFGFVVARIARESLAIGLGLIGAGIIVCMISAVRHTRYVRALDEGRFRAAFGSHFAFGLVALLTLIGLALAFGLVRLP